MKETTEIKLVSRDVDVDTVLSDDAPANEIEQNTDPSCSSNVVEDVEVQDSSSEESGIGMAVDEQEAGPSGVPVEWQEATVVSGCCVYDKFVTGQRRLCCSIIL